MIPHSEQEKQVSLVARVPDSISDTLFIASFKEWLTQFKGITFIGYHCKEMQQVGGNKK